MAVYVTFKVFGLIIELLFQIKNLTLKAMKKLMSAFLFLSALLCSCSHYYYVLSTRNVPLFREKN